MTPHADPPERPEHVVEHLAQRVTRLEESWAFGERDARATLEQLLDLDKRLRLIARRLDAIEQRLAAADADPNTPPREGDADRTDASAEMP